MNDTEWLPVPIFVFLPRVTVKVCKREGGMSAGAGRRLLQDSSEDQYLMSWQRYYDAEYEEYSCPIGSYSNDGTNSSCTICPGGKTTRAAGSDKASDCVCAKDSYGGASCTACPSGYVTEEAGATDSSSCVLKTTPDDDDDMGIDDPTGGAQRERPMLTELLIVFVSMMTVLMQGQILVL